MTEEQLDEFKNKIYIHYREKGFPYYSTNYNDRFLDYASLINYDRTGMIKDEVVKQTMHGLG
jgi:hypothetical protein